MRLKSLLQLIGNYKKSLTFTLSKIIIFIIAVIIVVQVEEQQVPLEVLESF